MNFKNSLATQISWTTIVIVMVILLAMGIGLVWIAYNAEQESAFQLQEKNAEKVSILISGYMNHIIEELDLLEKVQSLGSITGLEQQKALEELLIYRPDLYSQFLLLDPNGAEKVKISRFHSYLPSEMETAVKTPEIENALNGSISISPVYLSPDSGLLSVQITMPLKTRNNIITGVLIAEVNVIRLWQEISKTQIGKQGYAYLVNETGRFIAYQEITEVFQNYNKDMSTIPPVAEFLSQEKVGPRHVYEYQGLKDEPVIGVYAPIEGTDWAVIVELPIKEAYDPVFRMQWYLIGLLVLGTIAAGGIGLFVSRRLVHPITSLTQTARLMSKGDLNAEVVEVGRQDEVGLLARTFRHMQEELKASHINQELKIKELKQTREELLATNRELSQTEDELRTNYEILIKKDEDLQFTNTLLKTQQETSHYGILVVGEGGQIISFNNQFIDMWGIPGDVVASRSDEQALASVLSRLVEPDKFLEKVQYLYHHHEEKSIDEIVLIGDVIFERFSSPMFGPDGRYYGRVWYFLDITDRKRAERELIKYRDRLEELVIERTGELAAAKELADMANKAKSTFLSRMSHELRTPLNAILGYAQILARQENLTTTQRQQLDTIFNSGEHLLKLINDLLDLSRIEADKFELKEAPFHLASSMKDIFEITKVRADEKKLKLKYEVLTPLPEYLLGDERRVKQIILNLLSNAVKYTNEGSIVLRVGYEQDATGTFHCEVDDTGIGIPADKLDTIFAPFIQLRDEKRAYEGTGLGLSITKQLATLMKGHIHVKSSPGKGSRFSVDLKLPVVMGELSYERERETITGYLGDRKRILIVDDNLTNARLLESFLQSMGFEILTADNGRDAILQTISKMPHLILLDLVMPDIDGLSVIREIKKSDRLSGIKIIGISATVSNSQYKRQFVAACDDFIGKPINLDLLLSRIRACLGIEWIVLPPHKPELGSVSETGTDNNIIIPQDDILDEIINAANLGKYSIIDEILAELTRKDEKYTPFCQVVNQYAGQYDEQKIVEFILRNRKGK